MFRFDVRRAGGVLAVAMSLVLASPVAAAGRAPSRGAVRGAGAMDRVVLVLRQVGLVYPAAGLVATWLKEGHLIDPNGRTAPVVPPTASTNTDGSTSEVDEGHLIDPNG